MPRLETAEEFRAWAVEHHPSVVKVLAEDGATMTVAPGGFMWFGREDAAVEIAPHFYEYMTGQTDDTLIFGDIEMEYVGESRNGNGLYRRVKAEG